MPMPGLVIFGRICWFNTPRSRKKACFPTLEAGFFIVFFPYFFLEASSRDFKNAIFSLILISKPRSVGWYH